MVEFITKYIAVFIIAGLVGVYLLVYILNKRTPVPEECLEDLDKAACKSCHNFACSHK